MAHLTLVLMVLASAVALTLAQGLNPYPGQASGPLGANLGDMGGNMGGNLGGNMGGNLGQSLPPQSNQGGIFGRSPLQTIMWSRFLDINPLYAMMFGNMGGGNMMFPFLASSMW